MARASRILGATVFMLAAGHAPQAPAATWRCALSPDLVRLVCTADAAHGPAISARQRAGDGSAQGRTDSVTAIVNGTRFPLDSRLTYTVELWSPPTEADFVLTLARATICYRSPDCKVHVQLPADLTGSAPAPAPAHARAP